MSNHRHKPVVRRVQESRLHIVCEECGLLLDFRDLNALSFYVEDWEVLDYEAPPETVTESVRTDSEPKA